MYSACGRASASARSLRCCASSTSVSIVAQRLAGAPETSRASPRNSVTRSGSGNRRRCPTYAESAWRAAERVGDRADQSRVGEDPAHDAASDDEASWCELDADGVAHDVLEAVRLVEHHDLVFGDDRSAGATSMP